MQRRLAAFLLLLGLGLSGCSASDDAAGLNDGIDPYGGQTGSLKPVSPSCGFARNDLSAQSVPSSDHALVFYEGGCATSVTPDDVQLVDADGRAVPVSVERLGNGAVLIGAEEALAPGAYAVTVGDAAPGTIQVGATSALPMELGTLAPVGTESCLLAFDLELDAVAAEYQSLMRLDVSFNGGPRQTWVDFGLLEVDEGVAHIEFGACEHTCLRPGVHDIQVSAVIAGEGIEIEPVETEFELRCASGGNPPAEEGGFCSVSSVVSGRATRRLSTAGLGLAALMLLGGWRRKTRR